MMVLLPVLPVLPVLELLVELYFWTSYPHAIVGCEAVVATLTAFCSVFSLSIILLAVELCRGFLFCGIT